MNMTTIFKRGLAIGLVAVVVVSGCNFDVVNPGPVQDDNLNFTAAHQGLVNGAIRATQAGFGPYGYTGGVITHESMPSGHTGTAGTEPQEETARLDDQYSGRGGWGLLHNGRWIAEEALRRFADNPDVDSNNYGLAAEAHFWAGMASRTLGENACTAVFDGSAPMDKLVYFTDPEHGAIFHFDEAVRIASATGNAALETAATGARAAAHLFLGNTAAARADAQAVSFDFEFPTVYSGFGAEYWYTPGQVESLAFQSISLWGTPGHPHFLETGDSRVAWGYDNGTLEIPAGETKAVRAQTHPSRNTWTALIPMYYPLKGYAPRQSTPSGGIIRELRIFEPELAEQRSLNFNMVDGREMALVEAETYLMDGDWNSAMTLINSVRTTTPVYAADLAAAMDLTLHVDEAPPVNNALPDYFENGTPGDFSAGGTLAPVTANSLEEAWAALKFERYLELHLEGRRFGDRWRWRENNTPGDLYISTEGWELEYIPQELVDRYGVPRDPLNLCFPMPRAENDANDNVESGFVDWISG